MIKWVDALVGDGWWVGRGGMDEWMINECIDGWVNGWVNWWWVHGYGWRSEWVNKWTNWQTYAQMVDGWVAGQTDGG